jgi:hypothetical protein
VGRRDLSGSDLIWRYASTGHLNKDPVNRTLLVRSWTTILSCTGQYFKRTPNTWAYQIIPPSYLIHIDGFQTFFFPLSVSAIFFPTHCPFSSTSTLALCPSPSSTVTPSPIFVMASPKKTVMDDSTSETLRSANVSVHEKKEEGESYRQGSQSPTPEPSVREGDKVEPKVAETTAELTKVMTSAEGVEYPTGLKLGLISLALCLSVFLIALVCDFPPLTKNAANENRTTPLLYAFPSWPFLAIDL